MRYVEIYIVTLMLFQTMSLSCNSISDLPTNKARLGQFLVWVQMFPCGCLVQVHLVLNLLPGSDFHLPLPHTSHQPSYFLRFKFITHRSNPPLFSKSPTPWLAST